MYHFMSGYTAKVAGTEVGITEPTTTFCLFLESLFYSYPAQYVTLLGEKLKESDNCLVGKYRMVWGVAMVLEVE